MNKEILDFLEMIGVNNRFISLWNGFIFINNLKFSRFSRKREKLFQAKFPGWTVIRSKEFQKMCIRASRVLSKSLNPREKVFIIKNDNCTDSTLNVILEPYTRKYDIKIICGDNWDCADDYEVDCIASSLTLDREVGNVLNQIFQGKKIKPTFLNAEFNKLKIIHPLINIPESWIESWTSKYNLKCVSSPVDEVSNNLLDFLEEFIPEVRENMLKSALYVS